MKRIATAYAVLVLGTPLLLLAILPLPGPVGWLLFAVPVAVYAGFAALIVQSGAAARWPHFIAGIPLTGVVWLLSAFALGITLVLTTGIKGTQ
jgi:hypothetical protein